MIGSLGPSREVTIVGSGAAGLLMGCALGRRGRRVTIIEAQERPGGLIRTEQTPWGLSESAAHSLLAPPAVRGFLDTLGVPCVELRPDSRARFIFRNGRMRRMPLGAMELLELFWRMAFARAPKPPPQTDEPLDQWAARHLGRPVVEYALGPFVHGVYGARPGQLGVATAFPALHVAPGKTLLGTLLAQKGKRPRSKMIAPQAGVADIAAKLRAELEGPLKADFRFGVKADSIPDAENVVLAVPAYEAARLLAQADAPLSSVLAGIPYTPIVSVTVFMKNEHLPKPIRGVGVLVPPCEAQECMGILFNSSSFENRVRDERECSSFTMMLGGQKGAYLLQADDAQIETAVHRELLRILKIKHPPAKCVIHRQPRAIPQYSPQLGQAWALARQGWCSRPGRMLFGNYTGQVSLRGMIETLLAMP